MFGKSKKDEIKQIDIEKKEDKKYVSKEEMDKFNKYIEDDKLIQKDRQIAIQKMEIKKLESIIKVLQKELIDKDLVILRNDFPKINDKINELKNKRISFIKDIKKKYNIKSDKFGFNPETLEIIEDN